MRRKEEIKRAAQTYATDTAGGESVFSLVHDCFMAGAVWADWHPSPTWHSVADGDLPKEPKGDWQHLSYIVMDENLHACATYYDVWDADDVVNPIRFIDENGDAIRAKFWMEIPPLPTEKK